MKIRRYLLLLAVVCLSGCSNQTGIPEEIARHVNEFNGGGDKVIRLRARGGVDAIVVVIPYVTQRGLEADKYTSKLSGGTKKQIEDMAGNQDNWLLFVFKNGRIVESATLPSSVMIEDSVLSVRGNGMFFVELQAHSREWRPIEIRRSHNDGNHAP